MFRENPTEHVWVSGPYGVSPKWRMNHFSVDFDTEIRLVWERTDGTRLRLSLPASQWTQAEALCAAFLRF